LLQFLNSTVKIINKPENNRHDLKQNNNVKWQLNNNLSNGYGA